VRPKAAGFRHRASGFRNRGKRFKGNRKEAQGDGAGKRVSGIRSPETGETGGRIFRLIRFPVVLYCNQCNWLQNKYFLSAVVPQRSCWPEPSPDSPLSICPDPAQSSSAVHSRPAYSVFVSVVNPRQPKPVKPTHPKDPVSGPTRRDGAWIRPAEEPGF